MDPLVSVIIPTYNRASVLKRALDSVWNQTFRHFDLWVVDDGSTDEGETANLVEIFKKERGIPDHQLIFCRTENRGVSAARNLAIHQSRGKWLAFLDSDDEWLPQKLIWQWEYAEKFPGVKVIHGEELWVRKGVRVNPKKKHQKSGGRIFTKCLPLCLISPSAVMIERSVFERVGVFREDFPVCEDYDLWLKITSLFDVGFIEDPLLIKYGGHEDQLSNKFRAMDYWRILSLRWIWQERELIEEEKKAVEEEILEKGRILLNGYQKHQKLGEALSPHYFEVQKIVDEICRSVDQEKV